MDQIVSDIHQSGYPALKMFDPATLVSANNCTLDINVSCGLVNVRQAPCSSRPMSTEAARSARCSSSSTRSMGPAPCIIQRGTVTKAAWINNGTPPFYYTEVNNVNNTNVFLGYDNAGNNVALPGACAYPCLNISAIEITLNVRSPFAESTEYFKPSPCLPQ